MSTQPAQKTTTVVFLLAFSVYAIQLRRLSPVQTGPQADPTSNEKSFVFDFFFIQSRHCL